MRVVVSVASEDPTDVGSAADRPNFSPLELGLGYPDWTCPDCGSGVTKIHVSVTGLIPCGMPPGYWSRVASEDTRERAISAVEDELCGPFPVRPLAAKGKAARIVDAVLAVVSPSPVDAGSRQVGAGEDPPEPYELRSARYEIRRATEELDRAGVEKYDDRERNDSTDGSEGMEWSIQQRIKMLARLAAAPPAGVMHPTLQATVNRLIANGNAAGVASLLEDEWGILAQTNVKLDTAPPVGVDEDARAGLRAWRSQAFRDPLMEALRRITEPNVVDVNGEYTKTEPISGHEAREIAWDALRDARVADAERMTGPSSAAPGVTEARLREALRRMIAVTELPGSRSDLSDATENAKSFARAALAASPAPTEGPVREVKASDLLACECFWREDGVGWSPPVTRVEMDSITVKVWIDPGGLWRTFKPSHRLLVRAAAPTGGDGK